MPGMEMLGCGELEAGARLGLARRGDVGMGARLGRGTGC